jgi:hypothetical protein
MLRQLTNIKLGGMILIVFAIMLSACAPATVAASSMNATPCSPPTLEGNAYRQSVQPILGGYYRNAFSNPNDFQNIETIQYEAMKLLATQIERWSDSIDFSFGTKYIRATVTYLSPELIQTIILNHYLFRKNGTFLSNFEAQVLSKMETIANRNEHLFFVTLIASNYEQGTSYGEQVIIQLPLQSLVLTNSSNVQVDPLHDDHALEDRIDLTFAPAHGYFSFPMAITVNGNCEFLLDKTNNAHLVLSIPHITINGTNYQTRPWMLDYAPSLALALDSNPMEDRLQLDRTPEHFSPDKDLPVPITPVDSEYWEKLARFIWHEMTLDP